MIIENLISLEPFLIMFLFITIPSFAITYFLEKKTQL